MTQRNCDHCSRPFPIPAFAPHKHFCSAACRRSWHLAQRVKGLELLRKQQGQQEVKPTHAEGELQLGGQAPTMQGDSENGS